MWGRGATLRKVGETVYWEDSAVFSRKKQKPQEDEGGGCILFPRPLKLLQKIPIQEQISRSEQMPWRPSILGPCPGTCASWGRRRTGDKEDGGMRRTGDDEDSRG